MAEGNSRRYDYIFKDIVQALKEDYVGAAEIDPEYDSKFYLTACGTAHHNNQMTDLLMLRYVSQMLATTFDRSLRFELQESETYVPSTRGFWVRRLGDDLVVTRAAEESRVQPGDVIVKINDVSAARHRKGMQKNFFYAREPERELWNNFLKMADHVTVRHPDGTEDTFDLTDYPKTLPQPNNWAEQPAEGVVLLHLERLDDAEEIENLLAGREAALSACQKLILDLRCADGDDPTAILPVLPWLFRGEKKAEDVLPDEVLITNYTQRNCEWKAYALECMGDESGWPDRLRQKAGDGMVEEVLSFWEDPDELLTGRGPEQVILLTDTWCCGAAERLAEAAQRLGAWTIGRPTMGTLDYSNPVTVLCDTDFAITWPMSKRKAVTEGQGLKGRGLPVDDCVPYTLEETRTDLLLRRALER